MKNKTFCPSCKEECKTMGNYDTEEKLLLKDIRNLLKDILSEITEGIITYPK